MTKKDTFTLHVGKAFHEFDLASITLTGKLLEENKGKVLNDLLIFVYRNGEFVDFKGFIKEGDSMPDLFNAGYITGKNGFTYKYEFKEPGMYTFEVIASNDSDKFFTSDFYIHVSMEGNVNN